MSAALQVSAFLVLVGLGQLFVITAGNGNIDLSIPSTMTLAGFVAVGSMTGPAGSIQLGVGLGLACGLVIGLINTAAILGLGIPPIVATLGVGLLAQSAVLVRATNFNAVPPRGLRTFVTGRVFGLPLIALLVIAVTMGAGMVLHRSRFGRTLRAVGQNRAAAELAGISARLVIAVCYVLSGLLAATAGIALSAFIDTSITLGDPYLLTSIAVVVLGGSLITGGRSNVVGVWGAAIFLNLMITLFYVLHLSIAFQDVVEGLLIIGVLAAGSGTRRANRRDSLGGG